MLILERKRIVKKKLFVLPREIKRRANLKQEGGNNIGQYGNQRNRKQKKNSKNLKSEVGSFKKSTLKILYTNQQEITQLIKICNERRVITIDLKELK